MHGSTRELISLQLRSDENELVCRLMVSMDHVLSNGLKDGAHHSCLVVHMTSGFAQTSVGRDRKRGPC